MLFYLIGFGVYFVTFLFPFFFLFFFSFFHGEKKERGKQLSLPHRINSTTQHQQKIKREREIEVKRFFLEGKGREREKKGEQRREKRGKRRGEKRRGEKKKKGEERKKKEIGGRKEVKVNPQKRTTKIAPSPHQSNKECHRERKEKREKDKGREGKERKRREGRGEKRKERNTQIPKPLPFFPFPSSF